MSDVEIDIRSSSEMTGPEKVAVLLLALGAEISDKVVAELTGDEINKITGYLQRCRSVPRETIISVLDEFKRISQDKVKVVFDVENFSASLVSRLGVDDVSLKNLPALELISTLTPEKLFSLVDQEHPQVSAITLSLVPPELASSVIEMFSEGARNELVLRMALLDRVDPLALKELNDFIQAALERSAESKAGVGGARSVAEVLDYFPLQTSKKLLEDIKLQDESLANSIKDYMFSFEEFSRVPAISIQRVISESDSDVLVKALKLAPEELKEIFFANMSQRMSERLKIEMGSMLPISLSDAERAQKKIIASARALQDKGLINLGRDLPPSDSVLK